jgi:phosphopantothenoylcysteine decarboxylase / phosphopantothenate---cysteine ligase
MSRILLGVSGGIAAYKACDLTRLLVKEGHEVVPLVTPGAERFVRAETFAALARRPAGEDLYLHLTRADLLVVAPCTANTLAKLAHGLSDNLLTEAALAHRGPVLVAPAMNPRMWSHPATRENAETLLARGVELVGPDEGETAEGEWGVGRMAEPEEIARRATQLLAPGTLSGRRVVVTAGGTREPLDAARFVGNRSSGRMGYALAREAVRRGAEVTVIAANVGLPHPSGARLVDVQTAAELADACGNELDGCDVLLMSAAVADFRPAGPVNRKLKKDQGIPQIELEPTEDVLSLLAERRRPDQVIVGFAAEHGDDAVELGRGKLERKRLDAIVVNDISRAGIGFESEDNEVTILTADGGERHVPRSRKELVARAVLDEVERLRTRRTDGARAGAGSPARV